jgi:hypothetical protein
MPIAAVSDVALSVLERLSIVPRGSGGSGVRRRIMAAESRSRASGAVQSRRRNGCVMGVSTITRGRPSGSWIVISIRPQGLCSGGASISTPSSRSSLWTAWDVSNLEPQAHAAWGLGWWTLVEFQEPASEEVDDTATGYFTPFAIPGQPDALVEGGRLAEIGRPQQDA